jgi:hypothetical protein
LIVGVRAMAAAGEPAKVARTSEGVVAPPERKIRWPAVVGMLLLALVQIPSISVYCIGAFAGDGAAVAKAWRNLDDGIADRLAKHVRTQPQGLADLDRLSADDFAKYLKNDDFRREVVSRLQSPRDRSDLPILFRLLRHPEPVVRDASRYGLMYARKLLDAAWMIRLMESGDRELALYHAFWIRFSADEPAVVPALERVAAEAERAGDVELRDTSKGSLRIIQTQNRRK